jgi:phospholipid transport system substrate-binding protein
VRVSVLNIYREVPMRFPHLFRSLFSFLLVAGISLPAFAGEPTEQVKQTTDKILLIIRDPALKSSSKAQERRRLIRKAADERFDWEEMARRSLGRHWAQRSAEGKKEFVSLFSELVERTYMSKVENYSGEKVQYEGETIDGDYAVVKVRVMSQKNRDISVDYRLQKKGNEWLIHDVSIEGVSLVNNYRTQFNSIILQSSYENLIKKMKAKVEVE